MCARRGSPRMAGVSTSNRIALALEVDLDADPIEGELRPAEGPTRAFVGWMGLAAALEEIARSTSG
jgi:hypothetical protein